MKPLKVFFGSNSPKENWIVRILNDLESLVQENAIYSEKYLKNRILFEQPKIYYNGPLETHPDPSFNWRCNIEQLKKSDALFCYINNSGISPELIYMMGIAAGAGIQIFICIENDCNIDFFQELSFIEKTVYASGKKSPEDAFKFFIKHHTPKITSPQLNYLKDLMMDCLPYFEVLNGKGLWRGNLFPLQRLNMYEASSIINALKSFKDELEIYTERFRYNDSFEFRYSKWERLFNQDEFELLFLESNKQQLDYCINFLNDYLNANLNPLNIIEGRLKEVLCVKRRREKETQEQAAMKQEIKEALDPENSIRYDGTDSCKQELIKLVKDNPFKVLSIENADEELWLISIQQNGYLLKLMEKQTFSAIHIALQQEESFKKYISPKFKVSTFDEADTLIKIDGTLLKHTPSSIITAELCETALSQTPLAFRYIPARYQSEALCETYVDLDIYNFKYVSAKNKTPYLCEKVINMLSPKDIPRFLKFLSSSLNESFLLALVQKDGTYLKHIPQKKRNRTICLKAFEQTREALRWVPKKYISFEMSLKAVEDMPELLSCISKKNLCDEIYLTYIKNKIFRYPDEYVCLEQFSKDIQIEILEVNPTAILTMSEVDSALIIKAQEVFISEDFIPTYEMRNFHRILELEFRYKLSEAYQEFFFINLLKIKKKNGTF